MFQELNAGSGSGRIEMDQKFLYIVKTLTQL